MRVACVGGGPAGLYFSILLKKADPSHEVTVYERNARGVTFGWGVVFSDETLGYLEDSDAETHRAITRSFAHWDAIDIHYRGELLRSTGHGFCGIARKHLLHILQDRAEALGVKLVFGREVEGAGELARTHDLVVAADGVRSRIREELATAFVPSLELGRCRYVWLGTRKLLDAFTFVFAETPHGWFAVHAYRFDAQTSTFIVECHEDTWQAAGLDRMPVEESVRWLERLFARHLDGMPLLLNRSAWINFVTVKNETWRHENVVLLGDAAHTAHFSVGSGTKLAMEDAIALSRAFADTHDVKTALERYEAERRPDVGKIQKAARESRMWFENVRRYAGFHPTQFAMSLLTRSRRVSYENLRLRDPAFVERVSAWFEGQARPEAAGRARAAERPDQGRVAPPLFQPFRLRGMELANRVVISPMCMYSATDGTVDDFHLVHLGSRAMGGAGLVMTEMTDVAADGRITLGCAGMYRPEHVLAWKRIVDHVHRHTHAKIGLQLAHAGRKGSTTLPWEGEEPLAAGGWPLISASPLRFTPHSACPREMDRADMDRVRDQFVAAARRAIEAGFDLLELHMAHGYLLSSFLSPLSNARTDAYGGTLENRMRYPLEVFEAVRAVWPEDRPMSVRISATDWVPGGFDAEQAVTVATAFRARGLDVLDASAGQTSPLAQPLYGRAFQTPFSDQIRNEAHLPTITVGNITNADEINSILTAGRADLCALARPHLADPYFTLHAATALGHDLETWPVQYLAAKPRPRSS